MSSFDNEELITVNYITDFFQGYYDGVPNEALEGNISYNAGSVENVLLSKDKRAFLATQFQSVDIIGPSGHFPIKLSNVRLDNSKGRGKGIFAKRNIKSGEVITLYPVDMCEIYDDNSRYLYYSEIFMKFSTDSKESGHEEFKKSIEQYSLDLKGNRRILAIPSNNLNESFLGHMANDGATDFSSRRSYLETSLKSQNAVIKSIPEDNPYMYALVATKDISENEEVFLTYSMKYWFKDKDIEFLEFVDSNANPAIDQIRRVVHEDALTDFKNSNKSKFLVMYKQGSEVICCALLMNKNPDKNYAYKYSSSHHHDTKKYKYQVTFMNKVPSIEDHVFSDFLLTIAKRYPCVIFSNEEVKFFSNSGFNLV